MKEQIQVSVALALAHPEIDFAAVAFAIIGERHHDRPIGDTANAVGVSRGTVRRWLRYGIPPSRLLKIRDLSGVPSELLIAARMSLGDRRYWYRSVAS